MKDISTEAGSVIDDDWVDSAEGSFSQFQEWKGDLKSEHLQINGHSLRVTQMHDRWDAVHEILGGVCAMCMSDENLHVHHVYFDGGAERKAHGRGTMVNKIWQGVKNGSDRYQLLCRNCHRDVHNEHRDLNDE